MAETDNDLKLIEDNLVLTTIDNPYNPKTEYEKWRMWDEDNGYFTESFIARLVFMDSEYEEGNEIKTNIILDKVIQEILDNDVIGTYRLV